MDQDKPLISVIIPIYNVEKYLSKCIDSLLEQTYPNLEIILVDDGATDSCPRICDEYEKKDDRIRVIHKANGGLSSARNAGLAAANGEYIGFVDSDDYISRDMYSNLYSKTAGSFDCIVCTDVVKINENGEPLKNSVSNKDKKEQTAEEYCRNLLLYNASASAWSKLFHRSFFLDVSFTEGRLNEDVLLMFHALSKRCFSRVLFSGKPDYYYLMRTGSLSRQFGKAIYDAVINAHEIREIVDKQFSGLRTCAERFELYQNMMFLRHCPYDHKRREDAMCIQVQRFIRKNFFAAWKNPYFKFKEKLIYTALCIVPRTVSFMIERKK